MSDAQDTGKAKNIYQFQMTTIDGQKVDLAKYKGKVILIVNVASECGYTGQYKPLQALHTKYAKEGLAILAFPCNDFGAQEPGSESEIAKFCETSFGVTFPLASKEKVIGPDAHPLYKWIGKELGEGALPKWNFHKYLIGKDGSVVGSWPSRVTPMSSEITKAVEEALA